MITILPNTDIFSVDAEVLVNPVNCVGVMGKGLALQFKEKFPRSFIEYESYCRAGELKPGQILVTEENKKTIFHAATKAHWRQYSKFFHIERIITEISRLMKERPETSIAIPALGCGLGGLDWPRVRLLLLRLDKEIPEKKIFLLEPKE